MIASSFSFRCCRWVFFIPVRARTRAEKREPRYGAAGHSRPALSVGNSRLSATCRAKFKLRVWSPRNARIPSGPAPTEPVARTETSPDVELDVGFGHLRAQWLAA